ncbi:MAG TPA: hypothetical protein VJA16_08610 [Thermoanaerobaculia bacterium]
MGRSFGRLAAKNDARDLIQDLADQIANAGVRQFLRLILVAYDEPLAKVEEERLAYDWVPSRLSESIAQQSVMECLAAVYRKVGRKASAKELEAKAAAVLANRHAGVPWIKSMNRNLKSAARGIRDGR